jgi:hypothetical protein
MYSFSSINPDSWIVMEGANTDLKIKRFSALSLFKRSDVEEDLNHWLHCYSVHNNRSGWPFGILNIPIFSL